MKERYNAQNLLGVTDGTNSIFSFPELGKMQEDVTSGGKITASQLACQTGRTELHVSPLQLPKMQQCKMKVMGFQT